MSVTFLRSETLSGRPCRVFRVEDTKSQGFVEVYVYGNIPIKCSRDDHDVTDNVAMLLVAAHITDSMHLDDTGQTSEPEFMQFGRIAYELVVKVANRTKTCRIKTITQSEEWELLFDPEIKLLGLLHKPSWTWSTIRFEVGAACNLDSFEYHVRDSGPAADDDGIEAKHRQFMRQITDAS